MQPVETITEAHLAYWSEFPARTAKVFGGPPGEPDRLPCPAVVTVSVGVAGESRPIVRVPLEMSDAGGTIWLSTWNGLPIHFVEVQPAGESSHGANT